MECIPAYLSNKESSDAPLIFIILEINYESYRGSFTVVCVDGGGGESLF